MFSKEETGFDGKRVKGSTGGKVFARKLMQATNTETKEAVKNEAKAVDSLFQNGQHENIIEVFKHGWLDSLENNYFIDMELAELSLADYIHYVFHNANPPFGLVIDEKSHPVLTRRDSSELPRLQNACIIGHHIASGLGFMHEQGHVHRDLKPENGKLLTDFFSNSSPLLSPWKVMEAY